VGLSLASDAAEHRQKTHQVAACRTQTSDHIFKVCPDWKMQQRILWVEVQKETKRWKRRWMVRDLLADERCGQAALDFLFSTVVGRLQQYAIRARKHITTLRRARPEIAIKVRWCPAPKGVSGNEEADRWAKIGAGKPGTRGVEHLVPLPRSLANLKRDISEKKWAEARQWAGSRTSKAKYRLPRSQRPDGTVAGSTKRLASRFYQLKTGHCLTGQYLHWTKRRPTPQCWWCQDRSQTRDHLFKVCPRWRLQQKALWAEVRKETGRGWDRWKVRDLLADERCVRPVLDFLSATDVGRLAPSTEEEDAVSAVSDLELQEWLEEQGAVAEGSGGEGEQPLFLPTPDYLASAGEE